MDLERAIYPDLKEDLFKKKASFLARLGSGSAARSIEGRAGGVGKTRVNTRKFRSVWHSLSV